jgi:RNA polymerase sigma factor for flagellar operon FliA
MYNFKGQPNINSLLKQHSLMVKRIAHHMHAKLPASVEVDDLIQVGMMGLADAISKYDSQHGAQFETYANQRIRGAILDELRSTDWMSRTSRREQKSIEKAIQKTEQRLGRDPGEQDIANELGITLTAYQEMLSKSRGTQLLYLEELTGQADGDEDFLDRFIGDSESDPLHLLENQKMREALIDAIELLPEREQSIMSMYYEQEMNLKEMAAVLGITDSRVSQLHSQAIARLRQKMKSS